MSISRRSQQVITGINRASPQAADLKICLPVMSAMVPVNAAASNFWYDPQNNGIACVPRINNASMPVYSEYGRMMELNGASASRAQITQNGGNVSFLLTNNFTISMFFRPVNLTQSNKYMITRPTNKWAILWEYVNNTLEFYSGAYTGTDPRTGSGIALSDTQAHHIAYSYDGTNWAGYLDGKVVFNTTRTFSITDVANQIVIGAATTTGTGECAAAWDDIRIYSRGKSAAEVREMYENPLDLYFPTPKIWSIGVAVGGGGLPPLAPSNLIATAISASQINLQWNDNS